jgi:enhancing lycopene biosynthesis protein 2
MQFLTGYICIIAILMNTSFQVAAQAPAGPGGVDAETSDVMAALGVNHLFHLYISKAGFIYLWCMG